MQLNVRKKLEKTNNILLLAQRIIIALIWSYGGVLMPVYAESTPYQQWKKQQQQHDLRLAQKLTPTVVSKHMTDPITPAPSTMLHQQNVTLAPRLGEQVKVNINTATAQELSAKLDSIGAKKAQAIVAYRNQHGQFKRIEDLKNVKGIGEKIYARNQLRLRLND